MLYSILIGAIAGWLAGKIFKGKSYGLLMNIVIGIVGGIIGGWVFGLVGIQGTGIFGKLITSVLGAGILLWFASFINGKK